MPGQDLIWYGTTGRPGTADGQAQPDPALYLGDWRASNVLHSLQGTLTQAQTDRSRHYVIDAARIGAGVQAYALRWLAMVTGPNALAAARVEAFDTATGTFLLDRPLGPGNAAAGNVYRLWTVRNVWPDVSAAQAASGHTVYRAIVLRNQHAGALANVRIYFRDLSAGASDFSRFHPSAGLAGSAFLSRADGETDLFSGTGQRDPQGGSDGFGGSGSWQTCFGPAVADTLVASLAQNSFVPIWLRRATPAGVGHRRSVAMQIVLETSTTGSDPSPLATCAILPFDMVADAPAPAGAVEPDRWTHIGGGTRLRGLATRGAGPEAFRVVRWRLRPGDLGALYTDDDPLAGHDRTSAAGVTAATYRAPEDPAAAGLRVRAQLVIGAGAEVGNPQPRLSLEAETSFGWDAQGDVALPSATRSYDEDPSPGAWAST